MKDVIIFEVHCAGEDLPESGTFDLSVRAGKLIAAFGGYYGYESEISLEQLEEIHAQIGQAIKLLKEGQP